MNKTAKELFKEITNTMLDLYIKKNADYGNSIHKTYEEFGLISFLVRMQDKMNRLITLSKNDNLVKDEKIEDTLLDLANYSILALMEMKGDKNGE